MASIGERCCRERTYRGARHIGGIYMAETTADETDTEPVPDDHLDDLEDGCGCAEVWEHLSEERGRTE